MLPPGIVVFSRTAQGAPLSRVSDSEIKLVLEFHLSITTVIGFDFRGNVKVKNNNLKL